jgi:hypothetical protein
VNSAILDPGDVLRNGVEANLGTRFMDSVPWQRCSSAVLMIFGLDLLERRRLILKIKKIIIGGTSIIDLKSTYLFTAYGIRQFVLLCIYSDSLVTMFDMSSHIKQPKRA